MKAVAKEWDEFRKAIFRNMGRVPEVQLIETRRAFYAGFFSALQWAKEVAGPDDVSMEEGVAKLEAAMDEIKEFYDDVKAGRA